MNGGWSGRRVRESIHAAVTRMCHRGLLARGFVALGMLLAGGVATGDERPVRFNEDVRPILSDKCFRCHGFDAKNRQADLRLDTAEGALGEREGGRVIVPGDPDASPLWQRILSTDPAEQMPPPETHKELSEAERAVLRRWIAEGAAYQKHWAFESPVASELPRGEDLPSHPVDAFLRERLQREGLVWNSEADRRTLVRRVAFALTGLPPTREEVRLYLIDASPDAYERMVDRYLQSPHFGEEMARHWLDIARYADTHGMHLDNERQTWAYRDWVVNAFNRNQPFDQFTIEQLAGDLLPDPTLDQLTATGFNRCNVTTSEGGSIDDELIFRYSVDRASTTMQAWTGLTGGCAVCHDHKFDPISQREFYSFYAFFHSAADPAMDGNALLTQPVQKLETPEVRTELASLDARIQARQQELSELQAATPYEDPATDDATHSFRAWWKQTTDKDVPGLAAELNAIAKQGPEKTTDAAQTRALQDYYVQQVCVDTRDKFASVLADLAKLREARTNRDNATPSTFIFRDLPQPRSSFVMMRGAYDKPGDAVEPGVPAIFPPIVKDDPARRANRLDLARWLVSPEHPLTARVTVNRLWQQFFGVGLVKTSYDFGSQGEPPSHPELLDWLAIHFRESGWNVKDLVRLLVTSQSFRQDGRLSPEVAARDPENRLLARGPRQRLDAEQIRDNVLFVSGLIDLRMGGPGVKPYQPANVWEPVGFAGSNTRFYTQDHGSSLYRRSLYTFLKRTAPPPFMSNFDAPNREQFCTRRDRSNTPLQALQLMNDVQHVEAARVLAERMIREGGVDPAARVALAFEWVLSRPPAAEESQVVLAALEAHLARYLQDAEAATKLVSQGESKPSAGIAAEELAAYTLVANMVLNLDETLTRN